MLLTKSAHNDKITKSPKHMATNKTTRRRTNTELSGMLPNEKFEAKAN